MPSSDAGVNRKKRLSRPTIRRLLRERGVKLADIAQRARVSRPHVSMVLAGRVTSRHVMRVVEKAIGQAVEV